MSHTKNDLHLDHYIIASAKRRGGLQPEALSIVRVDNRAICRYTMSSFQHALCAVAQSAALSQEH